MQRFEFDITGPVHRGRDSVGFFTIVVTDDNEGPYLSVDGGKYWGELRLVRDLISRFDDYVKERETLSW